MAKKRRSLISMIFTGSVLTNKKLVHRMPIFVVVAIIMLVYIAIGFTVQRRHTELDNLNDEITRLRTVSVTTSAHRQKVTRRREIDALLVKFNIPLRQLPTPPKSVVSD